MKPGTWINGKRRVTGSWDYDWATDRFTIVLDQRDRLTGANKRIVTAGSPREKPEWGNWHLEDAIRIEAGTGGTVKHGPTRSARAGAEGIAPTRHD